MRRADLEPVVRAFVAREARRAPDDIESDTPLITSQLLDSVAVVRLAALLEERLGMRIPDRDVSPDNFDTLARILAYVDRVTSR